MKSIIADEITTIGGDKLLKFLDKIPKELKEGPWSIVAHLVVFTYIGFVAITAQSAFASLDYAAPSEISDHLQMYRLFFALYGLGFSFVTLWMVGLWPFLSYTVISWNLMAFRLFFAYLTDAGLIWFRPVAIFLKFPALVGCSITVLVWWLILVPLLAFLLRKNEKDFKGFLHFNLSPGLINLHLLNLPISAVEFIWTATSLTFFDLWCGYLVALFYCLFYLNFLDPLGLHFYIIFSPRTYLCAFSFGLIIFTYYLLYNFWNDSLAGSG